MTKEQQRELDRLLTNKKETKIMLIIFGVLLAISLTLIPFYNWTLSWLPYIHPADAFKSARNTFLYDWEHMAKLGIVFYAGAGTVFCGAGFLILLSCAFDIRKDLKKFYANLKKEQISISEISNGL